jgi:hypothetical protein
MNNDISPVKSILSTYANLANQSNLITDEQLKQIKTQREQKERLRQDKNTRILERDEKKDKREKANSIIKETITKPTSPVSISLPPVISPISLAPVVKSPVIITDDIIPITQVTSTDSSVELQNRLTALRLKLTTISKVKTPEPEPMPVMNMIQPEQQQQQHYSSSSSSSSCENGFLQNNDMRDRFRKVGSSSSNSNSNRYEPTEEDRKRRDELRYYRKKATIEEEIAISQAATLLDLMSTFIENLSSTVGFDAVKLGGLATNIQQALEEGSFDLALKSYVSKPELMNLLQNPMLSFASTFTKVVMKTHAENVKNELEAGIEGFRAKKRREKRDENKKPSFSQGDYDDRSSDNRHDRSRHDRSRNHHRDSSESLERSRRRETYNNDRHYESNRYYRRSRNRSSRRRHSLRRSSDDYYRRRSRQKTSSGYNRSDKNDDMQDYNNIDKSDESNIEKQQQTTRPAFITKTPVNSGGVLGAASDVVKQFTPFIGSIKTAMDNNANISAQKDKLENMRPVNKFDVN